MVAQRIDSVYSEHYDNCKRFIEKSPANSVRTRFLQTIYPDATFVIIVRNGFAVSEGIKRKRWFDPDRQHMAGLETSYPDAALQWTYSNKQILNDRFFLNRSIIVKYEDIVTNPVTTIKRILDYCELSTDTYIFPDFETYRNQVQISRLSDFEKDLIRKIARNELIRMRYPIRKTWKQKTSYYENTTHPTFYR